MKATVFDWVKLMLDNSKVIYPFIILLISITGLSTYDSFEKGIEIEASQTQIAEIANYYASAPVVEAPVKAPVKDNCESCEKLLLEHKKEYHQ